MNNYKTTRKIKSIRPGFRFRRYRDLEEVGNSYLSYNAPRKISWIHIVEVSSNLLITEEYDVTQPLRELSLIYGRSPDRIVSYKGISDFCRTHEINRRFGYAIYRYDIEYIDNKAPLEHIYPALAREANQEEMKEI